MHFTQTKLSSKNIFPTSPSHLPELDLNIYNIFKYNYDDVFCQCALETWSEIM